jgi:CBS domain-containing protein
MIVSQVMTRDPVTVRAGATVKTALRLLDEHDITSMPVVDKHGRIHGVVSEADLIHDLVGPDQRLHELRLTDLPPPQHGYVDELMTAQAVTVRPETDLADAVDLVTSIGVKCLPVVDADDKVVGVVSRRDVVRMLARADADLAQEVDALLVAAGMPDWLVDVNEGVAAISGPETSRERTLARVLARTVPGVVAVTVA